MGRMGGILVGVLWRRGGVVMVGVCWERHYVPDKSIEVVLNRGLLVMFLVLNRRLLCSAAGPPLLLPANTPAVERIDRFCITQ